LFEEGGNGSAFSAKSATDENRNGKSSKHVRMIWAQYNKRGLQTRGMVDAISDAASLRRLFARDRGL
jgi:hypothetical protein